MGVILGAFLIFHSPNNGELPTILTTICSLLILLHKTRHVIKILLEDKVALLRSVL